MPLIENFFFFLSNQFYVTNKQGNSKSRDLRMFIFSLEKSAAWVPRA